MHTQAQGLAQNKKIMRPGVFSFRLECLLNIPSKSNEKSSGVTLCPSGRGRLLSLRREILQDFFFFHNAFSLQKVRPARNYPTKMDSAFEKCPYLLVIPG